MLIAIGNCIFTWKALCHIMTSKWFLLLMRKLHPGKCPLAICLVFIFLLFQLLKIIGNMQICTEFFIMPTILLSGCFFWNSLLGGGLVWWCRVPNYVAICSQNLISKSFLGDFVARVKSYTEWHNRLPYTWYSQIYDIILYQDNVILFFKVLVLGSFLIICAYTMYRFLKELLNTDGMHCLLNSGMEWRITFLKSLYRYVFWSNVFIGLGGLNYFYM